MKLAPLLTQYLYTNKRLDLPGIGTFLLDEPIPKDSENNKYKTANIEGVHFENNHAIKEAPDLISFIASQTGKMKALANADLESHLELVQQFLNIGKPFLLEGIGSLVKIKSGEFAFTSGQVLPDKMKEYSVREISSTSSTEESFSDVYNDNKKEKTKWKKPVAFLLLVVGVGLAILGGYVVYKNTSAKTDVSGASETEKKEPVKNETVLIADTSAFIKKDSTQPALQQATQPATESNTAQTNYKFVVEVANKERGLFRFNTLKSYGLKIKMETTDSTTYKLFFLLPAFASDTSRILDSLSLRYTPSWKKAFVEN